MNFLWFFLFQSEISHTVCVTKSLKEKQWNRNLISFSCCQCNLLILFLLYQQPVILNQDFFRNEKIIVYDELEVEALITNSRLKTLALKRLFLYKIISLKFKFICDFLSPFFKISVKLLLRMRSWFTTKLDLDFKGFPHLTTTALYWLTRWI